jgi:PKD repeat protein
MKKAWLIGFCLVILFSAQPAFAGWVYETIATIGDQGKHGSLAIDSSGRAHAAWYDASNANLIYSIRHFTGWAPPTTVAAGQMGKYASIAINPVTDQPAIAYYDDASNAARYAWFNGTNWTIETVDYSSNFHRGEWSSLAFNPSGIPYVAYHWDDDDLFQDNGLRVAWRTGSKGWNTYELDSTVILINEQMGVHPTIAMDTAGYPHIAYRAEATLNIGQWYASQNGVGWSTEPTVNDSGVGEYSDLALDGGDNPYISSWFAGSIGNDCAYLIYKYAGDWQYEQIECGLDDGFGQHTAIAIDSADRIHTTYFGADMLQYAVRVNGSWTIATLDNQGVPGLYTDIAIDSLDGPHILYYDAGDKDLRYVYDLQAPTLISITPDTGVNDAPVTDVVVTGTSIHNTSTLRLIEPDSGDEIPAINILNATSSSLQCDFDITGAKTGPWDLYITNPTGDFTLPGAFTVTSNPVELTTVVPDTATNNLIAFPLTLTGNWFTQNMTVKLKKGIAPAVTAYLVQRNLTTQAVATFNLNNRATGLYDVIVETDFGTATLTEAFEITCASPVAEFSATPLEGAAPLEVSFLDDSIATTSCAITQWEWDLGDESTSTDQNPKHTYEAGKYHVSLKVTSPGGTNELIEYFYIQAHEEGTDDDDSGDDGSIDDDNPDPDPDSDDDDTGQRIDEDDTGGVSGGPCGC